MNITTVSQILALVIQCATIVTLIYTLAKFAGKPNATQNERITALEKWRDDVEKRFTKSNQHFDTIDEGNRVTQEAILALIDHAIDANHSDKLIEAKDKLQTYLINK